MDALTVINSEKLIPEDKIKTEDKKLKDMNLFERSALLRQANEFLEDDDDLTDDEFEMIAELEKSVEDKIAKWGFYAHKLDDASELCLAEMEVHKKRMESCKKRAEKLAKRSFNMKHFMKDKMIEFNLKKVSTALFDFALRKKPQTLVVKDSADFNFPCKKDFVKSKIVESWDKRLIKEYVKDQELKGNKVKGFTLSETDFSLTIKIK